MADKTENASFKALASYFGADRNVELISTSDDGNWWLFNVSGPSEPGSYYLYNKAKANVQLLMERYTKLPPAQLAVVQPYTIHPGTVSRFSYLSRPASAPKGPLPLIVMPHGGPRSGTAFGTTSGRSSWPREAMQLFQPNFRGSGGYGVAYGEAGYKQWNGVMANDVTDGVQKLIASGQADPGRVCIFGAS